MFQAHNRCNITHRALRSVLYKCVDGAHPSILRILIQSDMSADLSALGGAVQELMCVIIKVDNITRAT